MPLPNRLIETHPFRQAPFRLLLITDGYDAQTDDRVCAALSAIPTGIAAVQLRAKVISGRACYHAAERLRRITTDAGARLLISDRVDIALAVAADGVHLPARGLPPQLARRIAENLLIGCSTHSLAEAKAAQGGGADYVTFGPVFETPNKGPPVGEKGLTEIVAALSIPVFALGGVTPENVQRLIELGAHIACIGAVLGANDSAAGITALLARMQPWAS